MAGESYAVVGIPFNGVNDASIYSGAAAVKAVELWERYYGVVELYGKQGISVRPYVIGETNGDAVDGSCGYLSTDSGVGFGSLDHSYVSTTEGATANSVQVVARNASDAAGADCGRSVDGDTGCVDGIPEDQGTVGRQVDVSRQEENSVDAAHGYCGRHGDVERSSGGSVRGPNFARNHANRQRKKVKRQSLEAQRCWSQRVCGLATSDAVDTGNGVSGAEASYRVSELQRSWTDRRIAENAFAVRKLANAMSEFDEISRCRSMVRRSADAAARLKEVRSNQQHEVLMARDVASVVERDRVSIVCGTELSKAKLERVYSDLSASGKSISPASSASNAEVRNLQKQCIDLTAELDNLKKSIDDTRSQAPPCESYYTLDQDGVSVRRFHDGELFGYYKDGKFVPGDNYSAWNE